MVIEYIMPQNEAQSLCIPRKREKEKKKCCAYANLNAYRNKQTHTGTAQDSKFRKK